MSCFSCGQSPKSAEDQLLKNPACPFCGYAVVKRKWTRIMSELIFICGSCGLGFDQRTRTMNYEIDSSLALDENRLKHYARYAQRITGILNEEIVSKLLPALQNKQIDVLEIGSGYGFMSDFITPMLPVRNYYHQELNRDLASWLRSRSKTVIESLDQVGKVDIIIMGQVLEHIPQAKEFLTGLLNDKLHAGGHILLLQTDHRGIIPRYFARLWYGWQLQEHYYHFTPRVFDEFCRMHNGCDVLFVRKYYLDQDFTFAFHGFAKLFLKFINLIIPAGAYDAFIVCIRKKG